MYPLKGNSYLVTNKMRSNNRKLFIRLALAGGLFSPFLAQGASVFFNFTDTCSLASTGTTNCYGSEPQGTDTGSYTLNGAAQQYYNSNGNNLGSLLLPTGADTLTLKVVDNNPNTYPTTSMSYFFTGAITETGGIETITFASPTDTILYSPDPSHPANTASLYLTVNNVSGAPGALVALTGTLSETPATSGVPEPTTYALMGAGLAGMTLIARRRRAKQTA